MIVFAKEYPQSFLEDLPFLSLHKFLAYFALIRISASGILLLRASSLFFFAGI